MPDDKPLTTGKVAALFSVHRSTVSRWADEGKLPFFTTPGGQRRFRPADVQAFTAPEPMPEAVGQ